MADKPECLCNDEDMLACDWTVELTLTVRRADTSSKFESVTTTKQVGLSMLEAANMGLHMVKGANASIGEAIINEVEACYGDDNEVAVAAKKMLTL